MQWLPYAVLTLVILGLIALLFLMSGKENHTIQALLKQNQDLMNRLQSQDLPTYSTMAALTTSSATIPDTPYISRSDEAEYARITGAQGVGEVIHHDPEMEMVFEDLGVFVDDSSTGRT